jgi:Uma2 family endonuclease
MTVLLTKQLPQTALTREDWEKAQRLFPDAKIELVGGKIIIMAPSGYESEEVAFEFGSQLRNWVRPRKLGRVTGSSAIFDLPNGDRRAPDVSFVRADKLPQTTKKPAAVVPDLVVEVKSPNDSLEELRQKIQSFLTQGTTVGILIDPDTRQLEVMRLNQSVEIFRDGDTLVIPDLLPEWELAISDLWSPDFSQSQSVS